MATPEQRSRAASLAANVSWARTPHRAERTEAARRSGPSSLEWHLARLPEDITDPKQRTLAAKAARRAYYQRLSSAGNAKQRAARESADSGA